ncbi:hypothetical protein FYK55_00825 [Roseiconus nitratireducens]|uniref:Uncharacterized protein n=1 Tax=Roseiconus nitratireducens TaxID=2605748 RepID=A0A5M6DHH5_9BACT|nr:hypothetical protein [Roseiconus nitratireducens]KAA5546994.1 hypothetical protein FYK55_00825 [Roseiconus nitratireducens]
MRLPRPLRIPTLSLLAASAMGSQWKCQAQPPNIPTRQILEAFQDGFQKAFDQRMAAAEAEGRRRNQVESLRIEMLSGMTTEQFRESWQIDLVADQIPADRLLEDLAKPLGWTVHRTPETANALTRPISIELRTVSRIQAFETICRELGLTPRYPDPMRSSAGGALVAGLIAAGEQLDPALKTRPADNQAADNAVTFETGARKLPVAFAGPCFIEVTKLVENPPHATGRLDLTVHAPGLPPSVLAIDQPSLAFGKIRSVQSNRETDLLTDINTGAMVNFPWLSRQIPLKGLLQNVDSFSVSGSCELWVPTEVVTLEFDQLEEGASQTAGELKAELIAVRPMSKRANGEERKGFRIQLKYTGSDAGKPKLLGVDDAGSLLSADGKSVFWAGRSGHASFTMWGDPARLVVKFPRQTETLRYPFQINDVPLQHSDQQPPRLTPIVYGTHETPVDVEVLELKEESVFRKVRARIQNHANKAVRTIHYTLRYLDTNGEEVKTHRSQQSGFGADKPLVARHASAEFEATAFFMPDNATDVAFSLDAVRFSDYSKWERPEISPKGKP